MATLLLSVGDCVYGIQLQNCLQNDIYIVSSIRILSCWYTTNRRMVLIIYYFEDRSHNHKFFDNFRARRSPAGKDE